MLRKALVAASFAAFAAAAVPAHALNPQPLPPSPCKCDSVSALKRAAYLRFVPKQHALRHQLANRAALAVR